MATAATKHRKLSAQREKKNIHTHPYTYIEAANKHGRLTHTHTPTLTVRAVHAEKHAKLSVSAEANE